MNVHVDVVCKLVALSFEHLGKDIIVEFIKEKSILQLLDVSQDMSGDTWMTPIFSYLSYRFCVVAAKALRMGYYWPTNNQDVKVELKTCQECRAYAIIERAPKHDLIPITTPWPFLQWGHQHMQTIHSCTSIVKYMIVAYDYFTKWVKAKPLASITSQKVLTFVYDQIMTQFGMPHTIITDIDTQIVKEPFRS
ncbi:reverse transcriptase domain-containing protein [Tanacetum coccineum]